MKWLFLIRVLLLSGLLTLGSLASNGLAAEENPVEQDNEELPSTDLQRFTTIFEYIKNYYVEPIEDSVLLRGALQGMLANLDPHSAYLDKEEYADLKANTTGKFDGLGIKVTPEDGMLRVITPIDDAPAERAGIQTGDLIIRLNETPVKGLSLQEALEIMRGKKGTNIILTLIRQDENKQLKIAVTRDTINIRSVRGETLEEGFGYVRVTQFQHNSTDEFMQTLENLKKHNKGKLKGLILDLRNNPGGVLEPCLQIADAFLDREKLKYNGLIVYTKGRMNGSQMREKAHAGDMLDGIPIVVLVNGGSASAAEIVAGALQDHKRALVLGTQTFGKGSVQMVLPLSDDQGLKLTTALYYTPAGRSIQADGIKPDVIVQAIKIPAQENNASTDFLREEELHNHLDNRNSHKKQPSLASQEKEKDRVTKLSVVSKDHQLCQALNILKGLSLTDTLSERS